MGRTPLLSAIIAERSINAIKRLLQEDIVDVNRRANDRDAPLHEAVRRGYLEAVRCLLEREDIKHNQPGWKGMQKYISTPPLEFLCTVTLSLYMFLGLPAN